MLYHLVSSSLIFEYSVLFLLLVSLNEAKEMNTNREMDRETDG